MSFMVGSVTVRNVPGAPLSTVSGFGTFTDATAALSLAAEFLQVLVTDAGKFRGRCHDAFGIEFHGFVVHGSIVGQLKT